MLRSGDGLRMAFSPNEAPIYGGGTLVIAFSEDSILPDASTDMYVVFSGSSLRHITLTQQINRNTLHSIIPGHNAFETVSLTVQTSSTDSCGGKVLASGEFTYCEDNIHHIARFLANSSHDPNALNHVDLSGEDQATFDQNIRLAFENLDLPHSWRMLEYSEHINQAPRETLLHFATRNRLTEFALYLLNKPSKELEIALNLPNQHNELPIQLARERGLENLVQEMQNQALGKRKDFEIDVFCRGPLTARRHRSGTISVSYNLKESYRSINEQIQMLQEVLTFTRVEDPPQQKVIMHHHRAQGNSLGYGIHQEEEEDEEEDDEEFVECLDRTPTQNLSNNVLQASMQKLQQITSQVQDFQDSNRQELMGQASRRENLSRFSCSCPSLVDKDGQSNSVMKPAVSLRAIASFNEEDEDDSAESEGCTEQTESNRNDINRSISEPSAHRKSSLSSGEEEHYIKPSFKPGRSSNRNQRHNEVLVSRSKSLGHLADGQLSDDEFQDANDRTPSSKSLHSQSNGQTQNSQKEEMVCDSRSSSIGSQLAVDESIDMVNLGPLESVPKVRLRSNKDREKRQNRSVSMFEPTMPKAHSTSHPKPKTIADHQISKITSEEVPMESDELEGDPEYNEFLKSRRRKQARMSLTEFLGDPRNFQDEEERTDIIKRDNQPKHRNPMRKFSFLKQKTKKEKKEREENRAKHQFVGVVFSNNKKCHQCEKSVTNKDALQCSICQVIVHNSSCKDNVVSCTKPSRHPKQNMILRYFGHSLVKPTISEIQRSTTSFKERTVSTKPSALHPSHSVRERPKSMLPSTLGMINVNNSSPDVKAFHRTSFIASRMEDTTDADMTLINPSLNSTHSASIESLDDVQYDYDEDIAMKGPEPESWSATMDKKSLKKMNTRDIKRQDHIFELIQTEKHHLRTLKIMQKIFSYGMQHEVHMEREAINKIFPSLNELVEIASSFHSRLKERQSDSNVVDCIGDVLVNQFDGESGEKMVQAYSYFCSRQKEAVKTYKDLLKTDRKFQIFIKKCSNNALCRRWSVPECILSAMHRLTKYPLLIQAISKQTKASKADFQPLQKAAAYVKNILSRVDEEVRLYEQNKKLWDIYNKVEGRAFGIMKNGKRFEKKDIVSKNRKLKYEGTLQLKSARGKYMEILGVLLTDVLLLLEVNNQKYTFASQDQKAPIISLHKLMVREVATDNKSIYLISTASSGPEMYEVKCESDDRKKWKSIIEEAVKECPAPDEIQDTEIDEHNRLTEARAKKIKQFISDLQEKDNQLKALAIDKCNMVLELSKVIRNDDSDLQQSEDMSFMKSTELLMKSLEEVTQLTSSVCSVHNMGLGRSASSAGEHFSGTSQLPALPKRAETFSGFDSSVKEHATFEFGLPGTNLQRRYSRKNSTENRSSSSPNLSKEQCNSLQSEETDKGGSDPTLNPDTRSLAGIKIGSQSTKSQMGRSLSDAADWKAMKEREKAFAALRTTDPNQTIDSDNSQGDLSSSIDSTPGATTHIPSNETVNATTRLTQYLNSLLVLTSRQETELQSLHHQLSEATKRISELTQHTVRLEEEHELQFNTSKQVKLDQEEVHLMQHKLREERQEVEEEKDKMQNELEKQQIMFESQQELLLKETSEKERLQQRVDKLENELKLYKEQEKMSKNLKEERGDKWKVTKENNNQSNNSNRKPRSQSEFSLRDVVEGSSVPYDSDGGSSSSRRRGATEKAVPIHLLSATNELDTSGEIKQTLPFKLSSISSSSSSLQGKRHVSSSSIGSIPTSSTSQSLSGKRYQSSSSLGSSSNTTSQMLPMKLANLSSSSPNEKKSNHRTKSPKSKSKKEHSSVENNGRTQAKKQGEQDVIYF
ncbi:rho guanine nucleotide exchange factor 28-like isoform X2 [Antedon mediterranea]|uniref:rho guanine nucleotide exchange factor 28-like isoform X2 n=1 Tax=Antedon mediterranea TaxID=105859 RepID=UPI003AF6319A